MTNESATIVTTHFEEKPIGFFRWRGRRAALARDVGVALGYEADGLQFVKNVTTEWAEELEAGVDFEVVKGEDLRVLKGLFEVEGESPFSRAPHLVVLFAPEGLNLAALLCRKPAGRRLRRWLAREVMPQIAETGAFVSPALADRSDVTRLPVIEAKVIALEGAMFVVQKQLASIHGWIGRMKQLGRVAATQLNLFEQRPIPDEAIVDHVLDIEKELDRGLGRRERAGIIVSTIKRFFGK